MGFYVQSPRHTDSSPQVLVLLSMERCYWNWGTAMVWGSSNFNVHKKTPRVLVKCVF